MSTLRPVDRLEVQILVDNVTDYLSSVPVFVETEVAGLDRRRRNRWVLAGDCLCCAAHGLSCLIKVWNGDNARTVLFDSGPEDGTFKQNCSRLGIDLGPVEAMVLSHGHWDHGGAMLRALQLVRDRNGGREVTYYTHPDMFRTRAARRPDGLMRVMADVPGIDAMTACGAKVVNTKESQALVDGLVYVSGEIPRVTPFERGLVGQHRKTLDGTGWEPDELIMDERFAAVDVVGKGLVVGGLHLSGANEQIIPDTASAMQEFDLAVIAAGHCTGWRAMAALANAFGDSKLAPLAVGKRFSF
jgi:7,8-dihydropterin-6-yl-methyl-4-(beta-D-ribofuranosyl)aminobenzene 5'-phosphate synthase